MAKKYFYSTYVEAKAAAHNLKVTTRTGYLAGYKKDPKLHSNPEVHYKYIGWESWSDFLGTSRHYSYQEARKVVLNMGIKSVAEYRLRRKEDPRLPSEPFLTYANSGWVDWYGYLSKGKFPWYSYLEAKELLAKLGVKSKSQYLRCYKMYPMLPSSPEICYLSRGWISWKSFFNKASFYEGYVDACAAVRKLGISSQKEYWIRYKEDACLPSRPNVVYKGGGWIGWSQFFGQEVLSFYTISEARDAVARLGITTSTEYNSRYKEDARLPSNPQRTYSADWVDWNDLLVLENIKFYKTYSEARAAAAKHGFANSKDYKARRRIDPMLPGSPNKYYPDWVNWFDYLGKEKKVWGSYADAVNVVRELGISSIDEYRARYRESPLLPSAPHEVWADEWSSWIDFLNLPKREIYKDYNSAKRAALRLGLRNRSDYAARYMQDPLLPFSPQVVYAESGWEGWSEFLDSIAFPRIWAEAEEWLKTQTAIPAKRTSITTLLNGFFSQQNYPDDPIFVLAKSNAFNSSEYGNFVRSLPRTLKKPMLRHASAFYQWVLEKYCADVEGGEVVVLDGFANQFAHHGDKLAKSIQVSRHSQTTKAPLGYEYILRARDYLVPDSDMALLNRPTLKDLPHLQSLYDSPSDWLDVDFSLIDKDDQNCVWRKVESEKRIDGKRQVITVWQVWNPVKFIALYALIRLPLRGQQILWLDSGEADKNCAVIDGSGRIRWERNTGPLAGQGVQRYEDQAAVRKGFDGEPNLYITTNKTGDRGYSIEWIPDDLIYWFLLLRDWQAKYNPIKCPTSWSEIGLNVEINQDILKSRGTQCFLFRVDSSGQPLKTGSAFALKLPELLYIIQREGEDLSSLLGGGKYKSEYTPHSLRVGLITAYVADGEVPVHIISKLVGHSSIVMTLYYTKLNNEQMRRPMMEAEKRAAVIALERQAARLRSQGIKSIKHQLIATDGNKHLLESDLPRSALVIFDWGICSMSAAMCHVGGKILFERKHEVFYEAVEAGYLGQKNCLRCRFFITGVPFVLGLTSLANELLLEINFESERYQEYTSEVGRLEGEWYDACQSGRAYVYESARKMAVANQQQSASKLDGMLRDFTAVNHYVRDSLKLVDTSATDSSDGYRLLVSGEAADLSVAFEESESNYHLLAEICQNAEIFKSSNPSRAIPLISQAIDRMSESNGFTPTLFKLSDKQKLVVINELNRLLLTRLGSWDRINDLLSGRVTLLDIDLPESNLTSITSDVRKLLNGASVKSSKKVALID